MGRMGIMEMMEMKFFEPPSSSFQGGVHISYQASLLSEERGRNRPPVHKICRQYNNMVFYRSVNGFVFIPRTSQNNNVVECSVRGGITLCEINV